MDEPIELKQGETTKVGYGSPPKHTRFLKGLSGNPRGRPKGTLNMATVLKKVLREKVVINENGERKTVTKLEALIKQLTNKAAGGELKAVQLLAALVRYEEERENQALQRLETVTPPDQEVKIVVVYEDPPAVRKA